MPYRGWARLALLNFFLVAVAGAIMRYKIAYSLPLVDQKHLLHGHSHFAFSGWVTAALFTIIASLISPAQEQKWHRRLFIFLMLASYGMLLTFPFMGYAFPSIFFSALTVLFSYVAMLITWKPLGSLGEPGKWIRVGMVFNALSSFGTYALAYLMKQPGVSQELYIGSVYFFLHFQYNGWFFFAVTGIFLHYVKPQWKDPVLAARSRKWFTLAVVPGFFLSTLWMRLPLGIYLLALTAAVLQLPAFWFLLRSVKFRLSALDRPVRVAWSLALLALGIKLILQLLSCIPGLSVFAFGYRPLVIAFLHLVLLGFVSLFLLGYFIARGWHSGSGPFYILVSGIVLNEVFLIIQGLGAIGYIAVPGMNIALFLNSVVMVLALVFQLRDRGFLKISGTDVLQRPGK